MKILQKSIAVALSAALFSGMAFAASNTSSAKKNSAGGVRTVARSESASPSDVQFAQSVSDALENGSIEDALALFDSYATEDSSLLSLKAGLLLSSGNVKDADSIASKLLKENPDDIGILELNMMIAKKKKTQMIINKVRCLIISIKY